MRTLLQKIQSICIFPNDSKHECKMDPFLKSIQQVDSCYELWATLIKRRGLLDHGWCKDSTMEERIMPNPTQPSRFSQGFNKRLDLLPWMHNPPNKHWKRFLDLPSTSKTQIHMHPVQCKYENLPQNGHNEDFSVRSYILKSCQQLFAIFALRQFLFQILF